MDAQTEYEVEKMFHVVTETLESVFELYPRIKTISFYKGVEYGEKVDGFIHYKNQEDCEPFFGVEQFKKLLITAKPKYKRYWGTI
jgi:hypothetical protein